MDQILLNNKPKPQLKLLLIIFLSNQLNKHKTVMILFKISILIKIHLRIHLRIITSNLMLTLLKIDPKLLSKYKVVFLSNSVVV